MISNKIYMLKIFTIFILFNCFDSYADEVVKADKLSQNDTVKKFPYINPLNDVRRFFYGNPVLDVPCSCGMINGVKIWDNMSYQPELDSPINHILYTNLKKQIKRIEIKGVTKKANETWEEIDIKYYGKKGFIYEFYENGFLKEEINSVKNRTEKHFLFTKKDGSTLIIDEKFLGKLGVDTKTDSIIVDNLNLPETGSFHEFNVGGYLTSRVLNINYNDKLQILSEEYKSIVPDNFHTNKRFHYNTSEVYGYGYDGRALNVKKKKEPSSSDLDYWIFEHGTHPICEYDAHGNPIGWRVGKQRKLCGTNYQNSYDAGGKILKCSVFENCTSGNNTKEHNYLVKVFVFKYDLKGNINEIVKKDAEPIYNKDRQIIDSKIVEKNIEKIELKHDENNLLTSVIIYKFLKGDFIGEIKTEYKIEYY